MKVLNAATPEMETYIEEMSEHLVYNILPCYFSQEEIQTYKNVQFLSISYAKQKAYNGFLHEALKVISSMQTITNLIETVQTREITNQDRKLFHHNISILEKYGFLFPFEMDYFSKERYQITHGHYEYRFIVN